MANINEQITILRNAVYGREVREAFISALTKINDIAGTVPNIQIEEGGVTLSESPDEYGAYISGTREEPRLYITIPRGLTGASPKLFMGDITIVEPGANPEAEIVPDADDPYKLTLNLKIPRGVTGLTPNLSVQVTDIGPEESAYATVSGTAENPTFNLFIPRGAVPKLTAGTVTMVGNTDDASVDFSGTTEAPVLNFTIPMGPTGLTPKIGIGNITTVDADSDANVTLGGTDENPLLNFSIPRGHNGKVDGITFTSQNPVGLGSVASAGEVDEIPRADHVHPLPDKATLMDIIGSLDISDVSGLQNAFDNLDADAVGALPSDWKPIRTTVKIDGSNWTASDQSSSDWESLDPSDNEDTFYTKIIDVPGTTTTNNIIVGPAFTGNANSDTDMRKKWSKVVNIGCVTDGTLQIVCKGEALSDFNMLVMII